jgi:hypothetical protein
MEIVTYLLKNLLLANGNKNGQTLPKLSDSECPFKLDRN